MQWLSFFFVKIIKQKLSKFLTLTPLGLDLMQLYSSYSNDFDMSLKKRYVATNWCHLLNFLRIYWHWKLKIFSRPCLNRYMYPHFILNCTTAVRYINKIVYVRFWLVSFFVDLAVDATGEKQINTAIRPIVFCLIWRSLKIMTSVNLFFFWF